MTQQVDRSKPNRPPEPGIGEREPGGKGDNQDSRLVNGGWMENQKSHGRREEEANGEHTFWSSPPGGNETPSRQPDHREGFCQGAEEEEGFNEQHRDPRDAPAHGAWVARDDNRWTDAHRA